MSRILVVYSSLFGAGAEVAELAGEVLTSLGAEVRVRGVRQVVLAEHQTDAARVDPLVTDADLTWADGYVFESPSHTGLPSAAIKAFVDEHHDQAVAGDYLNRTFTALATSSFAHAGQERVVDDLNAVGAAWGCLLVPPSTANALINASDGNPYGLSFVLSHGALGDAAVARSVMEAHFARFVRVTDATTSLRVRAGGDGYDGPPRAADVFG